MNLFVLRICFYLVFLNAVRSQSLSISDAISFYEYLPNKAVTVNANGFGSGSSLNCSLVNNSAGFASVSFNIPTLSGSTFNLILSNLIAGRRQLFECQSGSATVFGYLDVKPRPVAWVCGTNQGVVSSNGTSSVNVQITISEVLSQNDTCAIAVTSGLSVSPLSASIASSQQLSLTFTGVSPPTSATVTFTCGQVQNFSFPVTFVSQNMTFLPINVVNPSTSIQLQLMTSIVDTITLNCAVDIFNVSWGCPLSQSNSSWMLSFPTTISTSSIYTMILTNNYATAGTTSSLIVMCCTNIQNLTASITVFINNPAIVIGQQATSTLYRDPRFYALSNCPCDLTVNVCDLNCCCDNYCYCSANVSGLIGPYGGNFYDAKNYTCQYVPDVDTEPYHSILCVQSNASSINGSYYLLPPNVTAISDVSANASQYASFKFNNQFTDLTTLQQGQISAVANSLLTSPGVNSLYLPVAISGSSFCEYLMPITFQQSSNSYCPVRITSNSCVSSPFLGYNFYLLSSTAVNRQCNTSIGILSVQQNVPVYTFYTYNDGTKFVDNGYNVPNSPNINATSCANVVQSVSYSIYYNGSNIIYIMANVTLGAVSIGSLVQQQFSVSFLPTSVLKYTNQSFAELQTSSSTPAGSNGAVPISGLYGYLIDKPVLVATNYSLSSTLTPLLTMSVDANGQCITSSGRNVLFLQNFYSQCRLSLTFVSCANLSSTISAYIDSFFNTNNTYVATYGNPSNVISDFVVPILVAYSNASSGQNQNSTIPVYQNPNYCINVITGVVYTIYYVNNGKTQNEFISTIIGVQKNYVFSTFSSLPSFSFNGSTFVNVTISTSVSFSRLTANISGAQNTEPVPQAVCYFDVCFNELLYPWMYNYEGKNGVYEYAGGVLVLTFAIFMLVTTHPWW